MSEQEIREGMLLAVWDEPPLDFDPDRLIRRAEQKKSRRRALVTVGVATAMIAVASFALPGLLPRNPDNQLASDAQTSSSAPPSESAEQKTQRIGDRLAERLALRMTNLSEVYSDFRPPHSMISSPPNTTASQRKATDEPDVNAYVHLTDAIGPTSLRITGGKQPYEVDICSGAVYCKTTAQKDGSVVIEAEYAEGAQDITRSMTMRKFQSGYVAQIQSFNYNPMTGSGLRQTVPVRVEVLTALVTDPSIAWE